MTRWIPWLILAFAMLALLDACTADRPPPKTVIKEADVIITARCNPDVGPAAAYPDTAAAMLAVPHPDAASRLQKNPADTGALTDMLDNFGYRDRLLLKGRLMRQQREQELLAALAGCKAGS